MKKLLSIAFIIGYFVLPLQGQYAQCVTNTAAGGVIAYVTVSTNITEGTSIVLPVGIKMFNVVTNNPLWNTNIDFGPNVRVLPRLNINAPCGYMCKWIIPNNPNDYSYSYFNPIIIESTTNLCSPPKTNEWVTNYSINLTGSQTFWCDGSNYGGKVCAYLCAVTNGYISQIMGRWGSGATDVRYASSQSSVAFILFNCPVSFSPCGFSIDQDNHTNWPNRPYPCDPNLYKERLYRLRCGESLSCQ